MSMFQGFSMAGHKRQTLLWRGSAGLILLLLMLFGAVRGVYAQTPTIPEAIATLEAAADALDAGDEAEAERLLTDLTAVTGADGERVNLATEVWYELLEQPNPVAATALRNFAGRLAEPQSTLPNNSRERLETILARPEFQEAQPNLLERLLRWLADNLPSVSPDTRRLFEFLIGAVGVVVLGIVIFFVVRMMRRTLLRGGQPLGALGEIPIHAAAAQSQAADAATAGDFREAMRLLYLAALLHLDEVGLVNFDRSLTNREVLQTVSTQATLHQILAPVVTQFDRVWYGYAPFGEPEFESMKQQIEQLRQLRGATP